MKTKRLLAIFALLCITIVHTHAQVVFNATNFPDANFRQYLMDKLSSYGFTTEGVTITAANLNSITSINVNQLKIANLKGIEHFKNLESLRCYANSLTELDVSKNTALTYIDCSLNKLTTLDVTKHIALRTLTCNGNQLTELDVSKNVNLVTLNCQNQKIATLKLPATTTLTTLDCGSNNLSSIDLTKNTELINLDIRNNLLTTINLTKNTKLVYLDIEVNPTVAPDLSKNTKLEAFLGSVSGSLDFTYNTELFYCQNVKYSNGPQQEPLKAINVTKCTKLKYLKINSSEISGLDVSKNNALITLDVTAHPNLTSIDVSKNTELIALKLRNNNLTSIDVSKNTKLKFLDVGSNENVKSLDVSKNTALEMLEADNCSLTTLDLRNNVELRTLNLKNNGLRGLDLSKQTKLKYSHSIKYEEHASSKFKWLTASFSGLTYKGYFDQKKATECLLIQSNTQLGLSYPSTVNPSYVSNMKISNTPITFTNKTIGDTNYHTMPQSFYQIHNILWNNNGTISIVYDYDTKCPSTDLNDDYKKMNVIVNTAPFVACGDNNGGSGNFPDANFRTAIKAFDKEKGGVDEDGEWALVGSDSKLSRSELQSITNINVNNKGIATLQGVEYMKNLQSLNCSYNNLAEASSLPLTYNTELKTLHCHHNQLTALDVSQNTQLEDLRFNNNMVAGTLNLSSHTFLQHLNGSDNQITSFVQPTTGTLVYVYLVRNKLTSLDLSKQSTLERLTCYAQTDKALTTLTLPTTPARLISLQAQDNSLSSIGNFDKATKLTELRLERNLFTSLDVSKMTQLQTFTCYTQGSYQEFTGLHTLKLPTTATLATLHIQNNNLAAIDLSKTTNLSDLKLTPQWISEDFIVTTPKTVSTLGSTGNLNGRVQSQMSNYTMNSGSLNNFTKILAALKNFAETGNSNISGSYKYNTKCASTVRPTIKDTLMTVTVKGYPYVAVNNTGNFDEGNGTGNFSTDTKFTDALKSAIGNVVNGRLTPQQIASVKSLDVANKDITIADGFGWFWNLENLNCNTNNLSSLNISFNTGLLTLNCHHNQLADSIDLTNHKLLQNLYCNNNLIPKLVMPDAASLKNVDCYENQLVALDFSKHSTLEKLNCSSQMEDSLFLKLQDLTLPDVPTKLTQLRAYRNSLFEIKNLDKATALQTLIIDNNLFTEVDLTNNTKLKEARVHTQGTYKNFTGLHTLKLPSSTTLTRLDIQNNNLAAVDLLGLTALTTLNCNPQWISEDFLVTKPQKVEALGMTQELNGRVDSRMSEYTMNPDVNMGKLSGFENIMNALKKVAAAGSGGATGSYKYDTKCASTVRPTLKDTLMTVTIKSNLLVEVNNTGNFTKGTGAGNFTTDTKFTDELKTAIRNVKNNRLSAGQIARVKGLSLKGKELTVADGFGWFWNLQRLYIGKNTSLSELDVTMNNELSRLSCDSCALTRVDASKNTKLEFLQCRYNPLTSVDVKNSPDLGFLDCSYTYTLTELDITNNPKLYRLACGNNKLKKLEVGHLTLLEDLTCGHNWFTETSKLDLTHSPLLFNLSCPQNNLVELDVSQNPLLLRIACYDNKIAALDLSQSAVLDSLNCSKNQIAALDLSNNIALTRLHCQENHLRTLDLSQHENLIRLNCNDQTSEEDITVFEFDKIGIYLPTGGKKENFLNMVVAGQNRAADIYSNGEQYLVVNPKPTADIDMYDKTVTYGYNTECASPNFANATMANVVITTWPYVMYVNPNSQSIAGNFYSGTIVLDYDAVVPAGTETYIVKGLKATPRQMLYNGTMYSLQQLDMQRIATAGEVIPANTPVYVKSNTQTGLHAFSRNLTDATPVAVPSGNLLKGSPTSDITVEPYSILTLGREKTTREVGFWQYSGTKSAAHRCYLDASVLNGAVISTTSGSSKGAIFCFDDEDFGETTGIDTGLNGNEQNDTWHTLSGIRLNGKPTKSGIYIHNGRKEVIK